MSDYIKREDAVRAVVDAKTGKDKTIDGTRQVTDCLRRIKAIPSADVRENVKGRWLPHDLENGEKSIDEDCCSVCGERFHEIAMTGCEWNFCPNCGAQMMRGEA